MAKAKTGRPRIELNWTEFEKLCALACTLTEIAGWFDCSEDTIELRCKEHYGMRFTEIFRLKRGKGNISLRRKQQEVAMNGNPTMLIFLGKQRLEQRDVHEHTTSKPIKLQYSLDDDDKDESSD